MGSCSTQSPQEKRQQHSSNVLDVSGFVTAIQIDTPLFSNLTRPYTFDKYLVLADPHSEEHQIYFFDKKDFSLIAKTGTHGEAPDEITSLGELIADNAHQQLYASDYGKMQMFRYELDSILFSKDYRPQEKIDINKTSVPVMVSYAADTLCYACCLTANPGEHFQESIVTWNMRNGEIKPLIKGHPKVERKRMRYAVSEENNLIAVSYDHHDLLAIYNLEGDLKYYIYGPNWNDKTSNAMIHYYAGIVVCNNRIIVGYSGEKNKISGNISVRKLLVYDLDGNYIKTLDTGHNVILFVYDPDYNRIIMALDEEPQFAYLELNELLNDL